MNKRALRVIVLLCLLCSLASLALAVRRSETEQKLKRVCPLMDYESLSWLAECSDQSLEQWCSALADAGLQSLLLRSEELSDPFVTALAEKTGLRTAQIGGAAKADTYFFGQRYDESDSGQRFYRESAPFSETLSLQQIEESLREQDSLLVLVENEAQTGLLLPEGWDGEAYAGRLAKGYWLNQWCRRSVGRLGFPGTEETENILYRGVVDRGIQALWLMPVCTEDGKTVTELSVYTGLLRNLETHLKAAGYRYGELGGYEPYDPPVWLLFFAGLAVLLAVVLLLSCLFPLPQKLVLLLLGLCVLENAAGLLLLRELQITLLVLGVAIVFPCLAVVLLCRYLERAQRTDSILRSLGGMLVCIGVAMLGALAAAALQSSRAYLMVLRLFRGVKLSQASVYGFSVAYFAYRYFRRPDRKRLDVSDRRQLRRAILLGAALSLLVLGVGAVFLLRTGDRMLSVSVAEQRVRCWLEHVLLYRPRTKEMLLAWPALGLAFFFAKRRMHALSALCGAAASIGFASVVNTFCHSRAHVLVSLARTCIGLLIGFVLALAVVGLLHLVLPKKKTGVSP